MKHILSDIEEEEKGTEKNMGFATTSEDNAAALGYSSNQRSIRNSIEDHNASSWISITNLK